jgi:hypothetical protein
MDTQFRITLWPDVILKSPRVKRGRELEIDTDGWCFGDLAPAVPLDDEVVLRSLLEVDAKDSDAVLEFMRANGVFDAPLRVGGWDIDPRLDRERRGRLHIGEASIYVMYAQALAWHWLADYDDERLMSAWERAGIAHPDLQMLNRQEEEETAWAWFVGNMNAGLQAVHPHITRARLWPDGKPFEYGEPVVDLYSGLTTQLFNIITESLPIRECANETCSNRFIRQLGRSAKGRSRTVGVRFCSAKCAKAQMQRETRRRKRGSK